MTTAYSGKYALLLSLLAPIAVAQNSIQPILLAPWRGTKHITQGNHGGITHNVCGHRFLDSYSTSTSACAWENTFALDIDLRYENVLAPANGIVTYASDNIGPLGGRQMALTHVGPTGAIFTTVYMHLSEIKIYSGYVSQGQVIAISGNSSSGSETGANGAHLHFHIWQESAGHRDSHTVAFERLVLQRVGVDSDVRPYDARSGELDDSRVRSGSPPFASSNELVVVNGDFRDGMNHWLSVDWGNTPSPWLSYDNPHSGNAALCLGTFLNSAEPQGRSAIYHWVSVPQTANPVTLSVWYRAWTSDISTDYDGEEIKLYDIDGNYLTTLLQNLESDGLWKQLSFNLDPYKGKRIAVLFDVYQDGARDPTGMCIGDVSIAVSERRRTGVSRGGLQITFTPNPVQKDADGKWHYEVKVRETTGVDINLSGLVVDNNDYTTYIPDWFGLANTVIPANGEILGSFTSTRGLGDFTQYVNILEHLVLWKFTGNGASWSQAGTLQQ